MQPQPVDSLEDERLTPYRNLKQTNLTRWSRQFIAEGKLVVARLLASPLQTASVLLSERRLGLLAELNLPAGTQLLVISEELAHELTGFRFHAGVMACGVRPPPRLLEELVAAPDPLLVACPRMTDPDNLGQLMRICRALGVSGLLLGEGCADPYARRTLRVSMGNAFTLPVVESENFLRDIVWLKEQRRCTLSAAVLAETATPLTSAQPLFPEALLLGNEADGLPPEVIALCDRQLTIPMSGDTDSLNVVVAAGIMLHWLRAGAAAPRVAGVW